MRRVFADLWETSSDNPFPGLTTHAYLWRSTRNVLFYSVASDSEFDELYRLGGIDEQYLSHQDEAGPLLAAIHGRFGTTLHAPAAEADRIGRYARIGVGLADRHTDGNGVEATPTPGHSPGSTSYLVHGADGDRYLFTGDTLYRSESGRWTAGYLPGISDPVQLAASLKLLATLAPDVVISSAYAGESAVHRVDTSTWTAGVTEAIFGLQVAADRNA
ncbi:MBL fold metallo-hydrolase [Gordonia terrae]|uniref:MBL fold metallo-hydrolase n=1 Tax=Gordonia hongkongensis TaxID=1701090 RepID=UPI0022B32BD2|nr:MBL fold metallo-hydrolase [Gordonia terrae]